MKRRRIFVLIPVDHADMIVSVPWAWGIPKELDHVGRKFQLIRNKRSLGGLCLYREINCK